MSELRWNIKRKFTSPRLKRLKNLIHKIKFKGGGF